MTQRPEPHPVVDALLPPRGDAAEARAAIAAARREADALARRVVAAEEEAARYALLYRSVLRSYGDVVRERDAARSLAIAIAAEQPEWHEGGAA